MKNALNKAFRLFFDFCRFILSALYRLVGKSLSEEAWRVWRQFIMFVLVGFSNTFVLLVFYYIVLFTAGSEYYILGQTVGYIAGIINSYFWNSRFVFSSGSNGAMSFIRMCICYGLTYVIQILALYLMIDVAGISDIVAPIVAVIITTPINYIMNKLYAFHDRHTQSS